MLASIGMVTYNLLTRHGKHRQFPPDNDFPCIHAFRAAIQKLTLATMAHRPPAVQGAEAHVGNPQAEPSLLQRPAQPIVLPRNGAERANCCGFILTLTCNLTRAWRATSSIPRNQCQNMSEDADQCQEACHIFIRQICRIKCQNGCQDEWQIFLQHSCPFF